MNLSETEVNVTASPSINIKDMMSSTDTRAIPLSWFSPFTSTGGVYASKDIVDFAPIFIALYRIVLASQLKPNPDVSPSLMSGLGPSAQIRSSPGTQGLNL